MAFNNMVFTPFDQLPASDLNKLQENDDFLLARKVTNAMLDTTAGDIGGAWKTWTPALSNLSGGTITYAVYTQIGKTIHFRFKYVLAGDGVGTDPLISVPVSAKANYSAVNSPTIVGNVAFMDANGPWLLGYCWFNNSDTVLSLSTILATGTYGSINGVNATSPMIWASGDAIIMSGTYEAA